MAAFPTHAAMAEQYSIVCMCQISFIQSSVEGHFSFFLALAIENNVAVNTGGASIFENKHFQIFLVDTQKVCLVLDQLSNQSLLQIQVESKSDRE